jgi:hypothetical protein
LEAKFDDAHSQTLCLFTYIHSGIRSGGTIVRSYSLNYRDETRYLNEVSKLLQLQNVEFMSFEAEQVSRYV